MFRESLIETSGVMRARRRWATLVSFVVETTAIGVLVLFPLIYTEALPRLHFGDPVPPPPGRRIAGPKVHRTELVKVPDELQTSPFVEPHTIPTSIDMTPDRRKPISEAEVEPPCAVCVDNSIPGDRSRDQNIFTNILRPRTDLHPDVKAASHPSFIRVSSMQPGMLIVRVEPRYPPLAVQTRTQGEVVLAALIGRDGRVENLHAVSGHPLLIKAALEAVSQWRYRPTILNGQAVEVETQVTVNFRLGQ
jgi:periplasmic protein TonB